MGLIAAKKAAAELENLGAFVACASAAARSAGFGSSRAGEIELAVEEALTNVCKYAGRGAPVQAALACTEDASVFAVELVDDGKPFDPTSLPDPDMNAGIEDRPIGGLGVFLMKRVCDAVRYRREDGRNVLRLEFRKPAGR